MQSTLDSLDRRIMVEMYQYVNTMIRGYPYRVVHVFRKNNDIFTYMAHNYIEEFRLILIPQSLHDSFKRLCILLRGHNVGQVYSEYVRDNVDGEPVLHACGSGGLSTYIQCYHWLHVNRK
jgi:hypothetical protein